MLGSLARGRGFAGCDRDRVIAGTRYVDCGEGSHCYLSRGVLGQGRTSHSSRIEQRTKKIAEKELDEHKLVCILREIWPWRERDFKIGLEVELVNAGRR